MRKIVVYLNDGAFGIAIDDNASDKEIKEQVLEEVIDRTAYDYEEVDEWPRVCALCEWHVDRIRFCLNKDVVTCDDVQDCEKWELKEEYD